MRSNLACSDPLAQPPTREGLQGRTDRARRVGRGMGDLGNGLTGTVLTHPLQPLAGASGARFAG